MMTFVQKWTRIITSTDLVQLEPDPNLTLSTLYNYFSFIKSSLYQEDALIDLSRAANSPP